MNRRALFALLALVPAAVGTGSASAQTLTMALCSGAAARAITVRLPGSGPARGGETGCCAKGCHTGSRKKSPAREFDRPQ